MSNESIQWTGDSPPIQGFDTGLVLAERDLLRQQLAAERATSDGLREALERTMKALEDLARQANYDLAQERGWQSVFAAELAGAPHEQ